jgi:hypothetical protein
MGATPRDVRHSSRTQAEMMCDCLLVSYSPLEPALVLVLVLLLLLLRASVCMHGRRVTCQVPSSQAGYLSCLSAARRAHPTPGLGSWPGLAV